jgi:hypothetical protein
MARNDDLANAQTRPVGQLVKKLAYYLVVSSNPWLPGPVIHLTTRKSSLRVCATEISHMCVPNLARVTAE